MFRPSKWVKKFSDAFPHQKLAFYSLLYILTVLSLDRFFHSLPISGYGLIVAILLVISTTTMATCHGIKYALKSTKPLHAVLREEGQSEGFLKALEKCEDNFIKRVLRKDEPCFSSFRYPTGLNEQIRLLLKDIERDFVRTWYSEISQNPSFLFDSHLILEEIFFKIVKKAKTISFKSLISNILILYLSHLQEYKKLVKKLSKLNQTSDDTKPKMELPELCRYSHPGSQNDKILNYYLKKVTKSLFKEFAPHDFVNSLECKILTGIISRKVFKRLLMTLEDPNWINLKLLHLLDWWRYEQMLKGRVYTVKMTVEEEEEEEGEDEFQFKKPAILSKRYLSSNLFESNRNLFDRNEFQNENGGNKEVENDENKVVENGETPQPPVKVERESLTLPIGNSKTSSEERKGNISTVLSGLISSTAGPLLPDNISVHYQALHKMWQSPVAEVSKDISESITNSFRKVFVDGIKERKGLVRSKSSESLAEVGGSLKTKDVSIGEELSEGIRFGDTIQSPLKAVKKLTKTRSFDNDSLLLEDDPTCGSPQKKSPGSDHQRDVSPVYEEPEDFATTIAKLRSLLQQRESNSTLSDKSSLSADSQSVGCSIDRSDSNKSQSLEGDSFDSATACEIPTDGRLFVNVSIPKTELVTDSGTSPYVLYCIQYDGIYMLKDNNNTGNEPELVLQTTTVKRRFQDFLNLQTKLEENVGLRNAMKGIKGPSKWVHIPFTGKPEDSTPSGRAPILESFLKQLCSKVEISNSAELHEFLAYGQTGSDGGVKKDSESSFQRIDKLLANKVTGVFNSIKTVLPSFDFDSTALVATNDTVKGFQEQKLLQGFLNFGNKPEIFEVNLNFVVKEPTGESLTDDIRHYLSEKSDCIEDAVDVLDSEDWLSEQKECRFITAEDKCVWHGCKDVTLDDELEPLDTWFPVYSLFLDVICELLQDEESWAIKEPVIRLTKVFTGHWEAKAADKLSKMDWDRIFGNVIRLLRGTVFQTGLGKSVEVSQEETKTVLKEVILSVMPSWTNEMVTDEGMASTVSLFVDSFQYFRLNRDFLLRLMDILLVHLLSCHHLNFSSS